MILYIFMFMTMMNKIKLAVFFFFLLCNTLILQKIQKPWLFAHNIDWESEQAILDATQQRNKSNFSNKYSLLLHYIMFSVSVYFKPEVCIPGESAHTYMSPNIYQLYSTSKRVNSLNNAIHVRSIRLILASQIKKIKQEIRFLAFLFRPWR